MTSDVRYLVQGYTLNQQRIEAQHEKFAEFKQAIALSARLAVNELRLFG